MDHSLHWDGRTAEPLLACSCTAMSLHDLGSHHPFQSYKSQFQLSLSAFLCPRECGSGAAPSGQPTHPSSFKEPFPSAAKLDSKGEYTPSSLPSTPIQHNSPWEAVTEVAGPRAKLPPPTLGACPRPPRYCEGYEVMWDSRGSPAAGKVASLAPPLIPKLKGGPSLNKELRGRWGSWRRGCREPAADSWHKRILLGHRGSMPWPHSPPGNKDLLPQPWVPPAARTTGQWRQEAGCSLEHFLLPASWQRSLPSLCSCALPTCAPVSSLPARA